MDISRPPITSPVAPAATNPQEHDGLLQLTHDKLYGLHGELLLLVVLVLFTIFLVTVVLVSRLKRDKDPESEHEDFISMRNCTHVLPEDWRRVHAAAQELSLQHKNGINKKFPL
ncbi:hypothetical protein Tsubulata_050689 [Turnera subulata]|uniref:Uncharacterized protein n=1 Tax=Turnera subulata TaxID=218843 RepID=A0A9Q0J1J8_9ROSI|nr:hypothetical protein Tsubulata_050689 [Turnera subulata]